MRSAAATTTAATTNRASTRARATAPTNVPDMAKLLDALLVDHPMSTRSSPLDYLPHVDDTDNDEDAKALLERTLRSASAHCHNASERFDLGNDVVSRSSTAELLAKHQDGAHRTSSSSLAANGTGSLIIVDPAIECASSADVPFDINMDALPNVLDALHVTFEEFADDVEQLADDAGASDVDALDSGHHYTLWASVVTDCLNAMRSAWLAPAMCQYVSVLEFSSFVDRMVHSPNTMGYTLERYCEILRERCARASAHPRYNFAVVHGSSRANVSASSSDANSKTWTVTVCAILPGVFAACFFEPLNAAHFGVDMDMNGFPNSAAALFRIRGCVFFPDALGEASKHLLSRPSA